MVAIPVQCLICNENFPEKEYIAHMETAHGTGSTAEAMEIEKLKKINLPPGVPPGITEADMPNADFMETLQKIQEMETKPPEPVKPPELHPSVSVVKTEPKPIELTYMYTGQDEKEHSVETLEIDVGLYHFAIAYCNQCKKQIESREVVDLKKGGTNGKPDIRTTTELPNGVPTTRVRKANKPRVQNEPGGKHA